jgi:hypothetical protein
LRLGLGCGEGRQRPRAGLVSGLVGEVEKHQIAGQKVTLRRTEDLKATIKSGKAPSFAAVAELPQMAQARLESESRLEAARAAASELRADEAAAEAELARAEDEIKAAIRAVVGAVATELAEQIIDFEARASELHERLGAHSGFVSQFLKPEPGSALHHVMSGLQWELNGPPFRRSLAHSARWKDLADRLLADPDAELSFAAPSAAQIEGLRLLSNRKGYD